MSIIKWFFEEAIELEAKRQIHAKDMQVTYEKNYQEVLNGLFSIKAKLESLKTEEDNLRNELQMIFFLADYITMIYSPGFPRNIERFRPEFSDEEINK